MEENLSDLVMSNKIFSSLDEEALKKLLPRFIRLELKPTDILFSQGDPSDGLYLVSSGKLSAILTAASGDNKKIGDIEAGETIGEAGALTNEPRSLTIKALRDSVLYKLPGKEFIELCYAHPSVMFETILPVLTRSRSIIQVLSSEKIIKHIVIVSANKEVSLEKFSEAFCKHAENFSAVIPFSDYHSDFNGQNIDPEILKEKISSLEKNKKSSHKLIYILKSMETPLAKIAFKKADIIYITAYSNSPPRIDPAILERIGKRRLHLKADPVLVLLHTDSTSLPRGTANWLAQTRFSMHHHVRINSSKDYMRLLRYIRGRAVGLVLGGGGTRGWSHLGVIKAIREARIPIDMIGGTSVGAIVAGCYAIHESYDDMYERFNKIVEKSRGSVSWRSLTWPIISLFNAKNFTTSQHEAFNHLLIEDLWLPFFCVSCNLAGNTEDIHHSGILWEKTRASSSIPGLIPPMLLENELHLDGGLLNNLPVDVMRERLGPKAKIIAVDLNSFSPDPNKYQFPPILTFKEALLAKLSSKGRETYKFPRFADMFLHGLFVGSISKSRQNAMAANVLINLSLDKFQLLHSTSQQAKQLINIGYEAAMKQIRPVLETT